MLARLYVWAGLLPEKQLAPSQSRITLEPKKMLYESIFFGRHRLERGFSSLFLADCLASPLAARISRIRGRKPAAATLVTGAARAFSQWTAQQSGRQLGRQAPAALDGIPTRCPGFERQQVQ